jgi:ATP-dependent helicase HrpA
VHQALTAGFLRNIGMRKQNNKYQISGNREVVLFPGSSLYNRGGQWIVAADFVHTSQLFARIVANIDVNWLEKLGDDLCKRSWSDPHWQKKSGQVTALEKVSLFGLILTRGRRVNYGRINRKTALEAREIFIRQALINGELNGNYPFLQHNLELAARYSDMEDRLRRRGIVMDDQVIFDFYDQRLDLVYDRFTLNRFIRQKRSDRLLWMEEEDVCGAVPAADELYRFPDSLQTPSGALKLSYRFQPGSKEDGVTVDIPAACYPALSSTIFEWLVPGLLEEKIFFLLKGLPKRLRKLFVPLRDAVDRIMDGLDLYQDSLYPALEKIILRSYQVTVHRDDWQVDNLPLHLRMRFRLSDEQGKMLHISRSFHELAPFCVGPTSPAAASKKNILPAQQKKRITSWDFTAAPQPVSTLDRHKRLTTLYYPNLSIDRDNRCLILTYSTDPEQAERNNRAGLRYFLSLQFTREIQALKKECKAAVAGHSASWLSLGFKGKAAALRETLTSCVLDAVFQIRSAELPDKEQFNRRIEIIKKEGLLKQGLGVLDTVLDLLATRRKVQVTLSRYRQRSAPGKGSNDARSAHFQTLLDQLLPHDFLQTAEPDQFQHIKKYLQALALRIERAEHSPAKDDRKACRLQPVLQRLEQIEKKFTCRSPACRSSVARYQQMAEEFRVSVFAPELGTAFPVSEKRLHKQWQQLENDCRTME